jgi:hypothetical protein
LNDLGPKAAQLPELRNDQHRDEHNYHQQKGDGES